MPATEIGESLFTTARASWIVPSVASSTSRKRTCCHHGSASALVVQADVDPHDQSGVRRGRIPSPAALLPRPATRGHRAEQFPAGEGHRRHQHWGPGPSSTSSRHPLRPTRTRLLSHRCREGIWNSGNRTQEPRLPAALQGGHFRSAHRPLQDRRSEIALKLFDAGIVVEVQHSRWATPAGETTSARHPLALGPPALD